MPELPEVETTLRGIAPHTLGQRVTACVVRNGRLRWPVPEDLHSLLSGQTLLELKRRGKYLLLRFESGHVLWHLGMSGSLRILEVAAAPGKHDHVDVLFANGRCLRFNDPRRFGAVLWTPDSLDEHPLLKHLGPEPLSPSFTVDYLLGNAKRHSLSCKPWVMDAKVVVGVGNIYANEALFAAGIHPLKPANKLTRPQLTRLVLQIQSILRHAIERGGTTLRDFVGGDGKPGYFAQELKAYGRGGKPCVNCGKPLMEKRLAQRSTVYCTLCQR